MKKVILTSLVVLMVVGIGVLFADKPQDDQGDYKGNGAPSGKHETINIIGVNPKKDDWSGGGNGSVIFVDRTGPTTFYVQGSNEGNFEIVDHDGTDGYVGTPGTAQPDTTPPYDDPVPGTKGQPGLIFPYNDDANEWQVEIWVRLLGPKGSEVDFKSYYYDEGGQIYVYWDGFSLSKDGMSKFKEQTGKLLANGYKDMLWYMDNKTKFRICQMRIFLLDQ